MASNGLNKCLIIGRLGQDPEVRYAQNGTAIANITVATSESWTDKQTNEKKEQTEWHRVVIYQRLAEIAGEYLRKGSKVYIEGRLRTRKWQDNQGVERYTTEIIANELQMLDGKGEGQSSTSQANAPARPAAQQPAQGCSPAPQPYAQPTYTTAQQQSAPAARQQPAQQPQQGAYMPPPSQQPQPPINFDDDIPFARMGLECKHLLHCI